MLTAKKEIELLPRADFKGKPEKYVDKYVGDDKIGHWQEFSIVDWTHRSNGVVTRGYLIVRIYGDRELNVGDRVTVGEIFGVHVHMKNITIMISLLGDDSIALRREFGF